MSEKNTGRVTIPTNLDVVPETIRRGGYPAEFVCRPHRSPGTSPAQRRPSSYPRGGAAGSRWRFAG